MWKRRYGLHTTAYPHFLLHSLIAVFRLQLFLRNMHGEPIVCSPDDAITTFEHGPVDFLALNNWLIELSPQDIKYTIKCYDEG